MYDTVTITMKDDNYAVWGKDEWDDFFVKDNCVVITNKGVWVAMYNLDCVKSVVVEKN